MKMLPRLGFLGISHGVDRGFRASLAWKPFRIRKEESIPGKKDMGFSTGSVRPQDPTLGHIQSLAPIGLPVMSPAPNGLFFLLTLKMVKITKYIQCLKRSEAQTKSLDQKMKTLGNYI